MACDKLQASCEPAANVLERARWLPELSELRAEYVTLFQGKWVDALEKLLAGFASHTRARDPIVEALFPCVKLAPLRRANPQGVRDYQQEFERRRNSAYVSRMLALQIYQFTIPIIEEIATHFLQWNLAFDCPENSTLQLAELRNELIDFATRLELVLQQVRLLAEAALLPLPGMFEDTNLNCKPRKRSRANSEITPS